MHPRWLRCSSLKYSRYSRSSRLASGAPRPSRCDARLSPRAARAPAAFDIGLKSASMKKLQLLAGGLVLASALVCSQTSRTHDLKLLPENVHWGYYDAAVK